MPLEHRIIEELTLAYPESMTYEQLIKKSGIQKKQLEQTLKELKNQKYPICLHDNEISLTYPLLSVKAIDRQLGTKFTGKKVRLFPSLESTNTYAKENLAVLETGEVIVAQEQTAGKGRLGREWSSPFGKSVSMSIVLKPAVCVENISLLTQLTAAALVDSLKDIAHPGIKWPNDVLINRKKIAGILIETEFSGGDLQGIIIGIGINTNLDQDDIPKKLRGKATSIKEVTGNEVNPNKLLTCFFTFFEDYYESFLYQDQTEPFLSVCRNHSILLGNDYWVMGNKKKRKASILDIDSSGGLVVKYIDNDQIEVITSTELSIRGENSYL